MPAREITARVILCCLVLTAAALHGGCAAKTLGKPWLKPPEQWSAQDASRIWYESPWVNTKRLITYPPNSGPVLVVESTVDMDDPSRKSSQMYWTEGRQGGEPTADEYRARWVSSRTMCLANQGRNSVSPLRSDLCQDREDVQIVVDGLPGFSSNESILASNSYLLPSKLDIRVRPISVEHTGWGKITFVFARYAGKRPLVHLGETSILFVYSDGNKRWKMRFNPREMIGHRGHDL